MQQNPNLGFTFSKITAEPSEALSNHLELVTYSAAELLSCFCREASEVWLNICSSKH